ncbi:hypothetical protein Droror1_Dr00007819 [Drosera rotundifolia]
MVIPSMTVVRGKTDAFCVMQLLIQLNCISGLLSYDEHLMLVFTSILTYTGICPLLDFLAAGTLYLIGSSWPWLAYCKGVACVLQRRLMVIVDKKTKIEVYQMKDPETEPLAM